MGVKKPEVNIATLIEKRQRLLDELNSSAHGERTETTYYGSYNPFDVPLVHCDTCRVAPTMTRVDAHNNRWDIVCPRCKKRIQHPQQEPWKALLLWSQKNLGDQRYRDLPLFGLAPLDAPAARRRLAGIRRDLELKKGIATADELLANVPGFRSPGHEYQACLDAYMGWAMLGLALLKREDGGTQRRKRDEFLSQKNTMVGA